MFGSNITVFENYVYIIKEQVKKVKCSAQYIGNQWEGVLTVT